MSFTRFKRADVIFKHIAFAGSGGWLVTVSVVSVF